MLPCKLYPWLPNKCCLIHARQTKCLTCTDLDLRRRVLYVAFGLVQKSPQPETARPLLKTIMIHFHHSPYLRTTIRHEAQSVFPLTCCVSKTVDELFGVIKTVSNFAMKQLGPGHSEKVYESVINELYHRRIRACGNADTTVPLELALTPHCTRARLRRESSTSSLLAPVLCVCAT